jgi:hypothetical protein
MKASMSGNFGERPRGRSVHGDGVSRDRVIRSAYSAIASGMGHQTPRLIARALVCLLVALAASCSSSSPSRPVDMGSGVDGSVGAGGTNADGGGRLDGSGGGGGTSADGSGGATDTGGGLPFGVDSGVPPGLNGPASLVYDPAIPTITFAASDIKVALTISGYTVTDVPLANLASVTAAVRVVVTTVDSAPGKMFLGSTAAPALSAQGFAIRKDPAAGYTGWWVLGADNVGAMYGGFELAETTRLARGLTTLKALEQNPYIANRGVKFNIPLDARTPSYSDAGTAAQVNIAEVWDIAFWHDYFDTMARYRFNNINIWNLHPFPSMVKVPKYPNVALADVKKTTIQLHPVPNGVNMSTPASLAALTTVKTMTIDQKIAFWQSVMQYAADRGIDFYIVTWNSFLYGTESSGYNFVNDVNNATTNDYFYQSVYQLIRTYPLLRGLGFAVAENLLPNGLTNAQKEAWAVKTYVAGVNDAIAAEPPGRKFDVFHRSQLTDFPSISAAMTPNLKVPWAFEDKYSEAHMFTTTKPEGLFPSLGSVSTTNKVWLNCRDDSYYMFRWADSEFMRGYMTNMNAAPMTISKVAGIFIGANIALGRETASLHPTVPRQLYLQKDWLKFLLFGRLGYDPMVPAQRFVDLIGDRFPEVSSQTLSDAWTKASQILPLVHKLIWVGSEVDWQLYPEASLWTPASDGTSGFLTIQDLISRTPQIRSGMNGIATFAAGTGTGTSPLAVADSVQALADQVLLLTPTLAAATDPELKETIGDIESLALLGRYYASKIRGATNKAQNNTPGAIQNLQLASKAWRAYAARVATLYAPQVLARMVGATTPETNITALQTFVDKEITDLGGTVPP